MSRAILNIVGKNIANSLFRQLATGLIQLLTIVFIARYCGPEVNGVYNVVLLLPLMLATFLNLGITPANVYFISSNQVSAAQALKESGILFFALIIIGIAIGIFIISHYSYNFFQGASNSTLYLALLIFPCTMLLNLVLGVFQGLQLFKPYNLLLILQPSFILLLSLLLVLLGKANTIYLILAYLLGTLIVASSGLYMLNKYPSDRDAVPYRENYKKNILQYGYRAHLSNILAIVNYKADILLVNFFLGPLSAGVYVISLQLTERLWIISQSVSVVILPKLSELIEQQDEAKILTSLMTRWVTFLTLLASIFLSIVSYPLITKVFGPEYLGALIPLLILLPGTILASGSRILANDFAAKGKPEWNMYTSWIAVVINILGNVLLIPLYGITGAAMATTTAYLINYIMRIYIYHRITNSTISSLFVIPYQEFKNIYLFLIDRIKAKA